jgi:hypothetical protein
MRILNRQTIRSFLQPHEPPCISLYMPTHRSHPDNLPDPKLFKNLVTQLEQSLREKYPVRDVRGLLEPFHDLEHKHHFWQHTLDGLAILANPGSLYLFKLQRPVKELVVVADSFHIKPLLRYVQSADRFHILALTRHTAKMYEGDRYHVDPVEHQEFPATITDALGEELTEKQIVASGAGGGLHGIRHGHGSRSEEQEKDDYRFFRVIDRAVLEQFSKPSGLPLILAALTEHQGTFRSISQNPHLLPEGIPHNPDALDTEALRSAAWKILEPFYVQRLAKLREDYHTAQAHQRGTADLSDAARAAVEGRIATLLLEADRVEAGRLDRHTGAIQPAHLHDPEVDDLFDDLSEIVLNTAGEVIMVPKEAMPTTTGLAAIYRF